MIEFNHVFQNYGHVPVLEDVCFRVEPREFVLLIGPSGAGKTTLLRHIYLEDIPARGVVTVEHFQSNRVTPAEKAQLRRRLGIIFQDFKLLADRNVFENVAFPLRLQGHSTRVVNQRVHKLLAETGLSIKSQEAVGRLSAGEKQRVCIARALVNDPIILLADEPTGNLDPKNAGEIFKLLVQIHTSGTAVLLASHHVDLAGPAPFRTLCLEHGRLIPRPPT